MVRVRVRQNSSGHEEFVEHAAGFPNIQVTGSPLVKAGVRGCLTLILHRVYIRLLRLGPAVGARARRNTEDSRMRPSGLNLGMHTCTGRGMS